MDVTFNKQEAGNEIAKFRKYLEQSSNPTMLPVGPRITVEFIEHDAKKEKDSDQVDS